MERRCKNEEQKNYWGRHIEAWKSSGVSKREYAEANKLSRSAFYYWCVKLSREPIQETGKALTPGVFKRIAIQSSYSSSFKVCFPNGLILEIPEEISTAKLSEIMGLWV